MRFGHADVMVDGFLVGSGKVGSVVVLGNGVVMYQILDLVNEGVKIDRFEEENKSKSLSSLNPREKSKTAKQKGWIYTIDRQHNRPTQPHSLFLPRQA